MSIRGDVGWSSLVLGLIGLVAACADAPKPHAAGRAAADGGASNDAGLIDAAPDAAAGDAAEPNADLADAGTQPPQNESFETARPLDVNSTVSQRVLIVPQHDYYSLDLEAGAYYVLSTDANPFSPNTEISVFDSAQTLVAHNDGNASLWPGDFINARVVFRAKQSGTYYVLIDNDATPADLGGSFPPSYLLTFRKVTPDTPGFALRGGDDSSDVTFAHDQGTGNEYVTLIGEFSGAGPRAFGLHGKAQQALIGQLLAPGAMGDGSSAQDVDVSIVADADKTVVASIAVDKGQHNIHPPVADAMYHVNLALNGDAGDNGYFVMNLVLLADNPSEQDSGKNGQLSAAEPIALSTGTFTQRGLLLAQLPSGDVDYYSFDVAMNSDVTVACEGESGGSGVRGLHAELRDAQDKTLAAQTETPTDNLLIQNVTVMNAGKAYLRLSADGSGQSDMIEPWVRCVVLVQP